MHGIMSINKILTFIMLHAKLELSVSELMEE